MVRLNQLRLNLDFYCTSFFSNCMNISYFFICNLFSIKKVKNIVKNKNPKTYQVLANCFCANLAKIILEQFYSNGFNETNCKIINGDQKNPKAEDLIKDFNILMECLMKDMIIPESMLWPYLAQ